MNKPSLRLMTETTHAVDADDLQNYIKDLTGHTYKVSRNEEMSSDASNRFFVQKNIEDDKYHNAAWATFKSDGTAGPFFLNTILRGLCTDGHIEPGIYYISRQ